MIDLPSPNTTMDRVNTAKPFLRKLNLVIGLAVFTLGILGILSYAFKLPHFLEPLFSFQRIHIPISLSLLGIGILVILYEQRYENKPKWLWPVRLLSILVPGTLGLYFIFFYLFQDEYHLLLPFVRGYPGIAISFLSACSMFSSALSLWFFLRYKFSEAIVLYGICIPALFIFYLCLFVAAGYFLEVPTLLSYKMSLPSAIGFGLVSLTLLYSTVPFQGLLLPLFSAKRRVRLMAVLTIIAAFGILIYGAIGIALIRIENARAVNIHLDFLSAIAELTTITVAVFTKVIGLRAVYFYNETLRFANQQSQIAAIAERQSKLLRLVMDNATAAIFLSDNQGRCVFANRAVEKMLGYTFEELQGQVLHDIVHRKHPNNTQYSMEECPIVQAVLFNRQQYQSEEEYLTRKDGRLVPVSFAATPFSNGNIGAVVEVRDITTLKKNQKVIESYTKKLEQSNKDLGYFATLVSHDLQAPLRKSRNFYDQILANLQDKADAETIDLMQRVDHSLGSMQSLIKDLLALATANKTDRPFGMVNLQSVITQVLSNLDDIIQKKKADIQVGAMPTLWGDEIQLEQLFQNLIDNALKYQPQGQIPMIKIWSEKLNDKICRIMIKDNGIGFNPEFKEKIFEPLERLHGKSSLYPGTGVGLAICKRIVEHHGGEIYAQSEPGQGATFTTQLPCKAPNELL